MATPTTAADTITAVLPYLSAIATEVSKTHPQALTALNGVKANVAALAESTTAVNSRPIVHSIVIFARSILAIAAGVPLPPPYNVILMIASSLLPSVVSAVETLLDYRTTVPDA